MSEYGWWPGQVLEVVVDASNVPGEYALTILSECAAFPRRLVFFLKGQLEVRSWVPQLVWTTTISAQHMLLRCLMCPIVCPFRSCQCLHPWFPASEKCVLVVVEVALVLQYPTLTLPAGCQPIDAERC